MGKYHDRRFPGESADYRRARDELLDMEMELRARLERVAERRRALPPGGTLKEDYVFQEGSRDLSEQRYVRDTRFSELFGGGKRSLIVYSLMYGPDDNAPCALCSSILDALNGEIPHIEARVNLVVVARAPISRLRARALYRGWDNLRLLSSLHNTYNADYFAEDPDVGQLPALNVFQRADDGNIYHHYSTELLYAPTQPGQDTRHVDLIWPLWNAFDLTPEGRGSQWYPGLAYD